MCGIFGYVGKRKDAARVVFDGLKSLEYRGYDSWGIVVEGSPLALDKEVGKLPVAPPKISKKEGHMALGHTRWATHGGVTVANAHPHLDCTGEISVVHNGIVENYQDLRAKLSKNHKFKSETDTEVVVHLVEELSSKMDFVESVRKAFSKIRGLNAFILLRKGGDLVAVKSGSPLVIGVEEGENFLASDPSALLPFCKKAIFVKDRELVTLSRRKARIFDAETGEEKKPDVKNLDWKLEESELGKFPHFMLKEIYEQPAVLRKIAANGAQLNEIARVIRKSKGTFFIGCGTASYAALSGTYLFSKIAKEHVNFSIGSEFGYIEDYLNKDSLVIAISQSGETIDVTVPVARAKLKGAKIVAVTNVVGSTLWREANFRVDLCAGPEKAVCATKSFSAMVASLIYLAYSISGKAKVGQELIDKTAKGVEKVLSQDHVKKIRKLAEKLSRSEHIYIIGRGLSYPTALEATLKIKEVSYIHSEGFAGGELKHGVIALIDRGTPCIVFAPNDETYDDVISNAIEIKARGGYIIGISPKENQAFDWHLKVEDSKEGSIIVNTVPIQLLTYFIALEKGYDPDKPRNLAKSVTVK